MAFDMRPAKSTAEKLADRRERERMRGRFGQQRFDHLAGSFARVIRLAHQSGKTGSLFGLEGTLKAGIRSHLCLQGWRWSAADAMACDLVGEALRRVRAVRPSWNEGQLEAAIAEERYLERTRCVTCGKPLQDGQKKFCSHLCGNVHHMRLLAMRRGTEEVVIRYATKII